MGKIIFAPGTGGWVHLGRDESVGWMIPWIGVALRGLDHAAVDFRLTDVYLLTDVNFYRT